MQCTQSPSASQLSSISVSPSSNYPGGGAENDGVDEGAYHDGVNDEDDDDDDHPDNDNRNNDGGTLLEKLTVARLQSSANGTTWLTR